MRDKLDRESQTTRGATMNLIPPKPVPTVADLLEHLGVPAQRVLLTPQPGRATEKDLLRCKLKLVELIDGVLVEKAMGWYESYLGFILGTYLQSYNRAHQAGVILGEQGLMRVHPGQLRMPDIAFYSWDHFPKRLLPKGDILDVVPDLAVEIRSKGNTNKEMARKRQEYFDGGAKLVWEVYPKKRCVYVYTAPDRFTILDQSQALDGGIVLPGFSLSISDWFKEAGERESA
jgi:Uma2 family endonuclease